MTLLYYIDYDTKLGIKNTIFNLIEISIFA